MTDIPNIMSIRELIDAAFGDANVNVFLIWGTLYSICIPDHGPPPRNEFIERGPNRLHLKLNVVNHKLVQTILVILARQLRLLERRVEVEIGPIVPLGPPATSLSVSEVKLHANVPRKKKGKPGTVTSVTKGMKIPEGGLQTPSSAKVTSKSSSTVAGKSTTERSTSDKSSTEKSSSAMTSSATKSSTEPSSSLKTSTDKSSSDKTKSSTDTKLSTDQTTSSDKTTTDKSSSDKSSTEKTSTDKTSTDKTSTDKTSTEKTSSDKTSTEDKTTTDEKFSSDKPSTETPSSDKQPGTSQRADSREEREKTPTPIASMDSMEKQYEKLLIVERVPMGEAAESRSQTGGPGGRMPRLSVVTQKEFGELAAAVRQLQSKFASVGTSAFPENAQLMNDLRKGASLTDAMAALQLAARVEAAEKALEKMLSIVTDLASKTPGINLDELMTKTQGTETEEQKTEVIFGAPAGKSQAALGKKKSTIAPPKEAAKSRKSIAPKAIGSKESIAPSMVSRLPSETQFDEHEVPAGEEPKKDEPKDSITYEELDNALEELYNELVKIVNTSTTKSNSNANNALKIANKLEGKLDDALDLGDRMYDLEKLVSEYADQINTLDTGLSSQMTNYQEQLTQMQHDLESGLEAMAEALANTGGDTAAVAELNNQFTSLQNDIDVASMRQKELRNIQDALSFDLQSLWKQIEILRDTKSDRDEVADALRDKAGLAALNGLVSRQEFDAVRGDFEKRIGSAYDKFNNQEIVWQKAIDDLLRELSEKADWVQLASLQDSINRYLDKLRARIQEMADVVGEPRAAAVTRKLHRESDCLSCATPAHMDLEVLKEPQLLPGFGASRPPAVGAEAESKPQEDGDHGVCYPGMPVPHAVDPRAHICHRYCGGSHTIINNTMSRAPMGMIINPALRKVNTAMGTDGKLYMVDEEKVKKPCIPCNVKTTTTPEPSEAEPAPIQEDFDSDMTPYDFRPSMGLGGAIDGHSVTPPPPIDQD